MNPDSRMFGSIAKNPSCIAWIWVFTIVEIRSPMPRFATMKANVMR
jgi:hypothetical protein